MKILSQFCVWRVSEPRLLASGATSVLLRLLLTSRSPSLRFPEALEGGSQTAVLLALPSPLGRSLGSYPVVHRPVFLFLTWIYHIIPYDILSFSFFFFCHTLKWNVLEFTCLPHPDPPSHLPFLPLPPGLPRAPGPSACLMHPTWAGDLFLALNAFC